MRLPSALHGAKTPWAANQTLLSIACCLFLAPHSQVNASDARGKADSSVLKGVGGKLANAVKELSTNRAVSYDAQGQRKKVRAGPRHTFQSGQLRTSSCSCVVHPVHACLGR
jgi:hypothetical protein